MDAEARARAAAEDEISAELHEQYRATARRLGWPMKPAIDVPYDELSEDAKELDRVFARWHLDAVAQAVTERDQPCGICGDHDARLHCHHCGRLLSHLDRPSYDEQAEEIARLRAEINTMKYDSGVSCDAHVQAAVAAERERIADELAATDVIWAKQMAEALRRRARQQRTGPWRGDDYNLTTHVTCGSV